jgi:putative colanic acid biosysnthesis UDP-glucose lipid carrier transferase
MLKFVLDKIVSFSILVFIFPLLITISLITIFVDGFPIIYLAKRVGFQGKTFTIYKFRSMSKDSKKILGKWGIFLRKSNLDELLQFINVFKGDMSIVGPRPHDELEDIFFNKNIKLYHLRRAVKPGITGLSAVNGNRGGTDLKTINDRVNYDLEYIEKQSLILDFKIFIKTIFLIFRPNY